LKNIKIVGAGLTGLIAAHLFPGAEVFEASAKKETSGHKALLRFRSPAVGDAVGIPFRSVKVHKAIWDGDNGGFAQPNIQLANSYSLKCTGKVLARSIWDLSVVERWIAPDDFIEQLSDNLRDRVHYDSPFDFNACLAGARPNSTIISTAPMSTLSKFHSPAFPTPEFAHRSIFVYRMQLANCDVYQTIYFPNVRTPVYRASITGDTLIIEAIDRITQIDIEDIAALFSVAVLPFDNPEYTETNQRFGKIAPIDDAWRRNFINTLSSKHSIYSLGRFATWRNILLDDVIHDCAVIKQLIRSDDYSRALLVENTFKNQALTQH